MRRALLEMLGIRQHWVVTDAAGEIFGTYWTRLGAEAGLARIDYVDFMIGRPDVGWRVERR